MVGQTLLPNAGPQQGEARRRIAGFRRDAMAAATNAARYSRPSDGSIQARSLLLAGIP